MYTRFATVAIVAMAFGPLLPGCASPHTNYELTAFDAVGQPVPLGYRLIAAGSSVYTAREGVCQLRPGVTVRIVDIATGRELSGESGQRC